MSMRESDDIVRRAESLTPDEKLQLAAILIERVRHVEEADNDEPRWADLRGVVAEPALAQPAQSR